MRPVVVLCGGAGTRLQGAAGDVPKVLAEVAGRPFLDHSLGILRRQGAREIVLSTGYRADLVEAAVRDRPADGLRVRCIEEGVPLGTGGALRFVVEEVGLEAPFFCLNGDTLFVAPFDELERALTAEVGRQAVIALAEVPDVSRYGSVRFDPANGSVLAFEEKAAREGAGWINAGVYLLDPALLTGFPVGQPFSLEREVFMPHPSRLGAVPFEGTPFLDIGTPEDYRRAEAALKRLESP